MMKKTAPLHYRADIDGLRAVAVVPVVLFHAGVPGFGGGFIGVDIFFVISGFLISSIIASEIDAGKFSIARFYQRRIRRIFPALIAVIAFSFFAGFLLLTPSDLLTLGESIVATSLFVSNVFFWQHANYFSAPLHENPLLHTWSLSIEEQFYLFYPLFLVVVSKLVRPNRTILVCFICLMSFLLCAVVVYYKQSASFYMGPTRAWELLIGGLIALGTIPGPRTSLTSSVVAGTGVIFIGLSVFFYTATTRFPGLTALPPVLGAAFIIWSGQHQYTIIHRCLAAGPFTLVGKASYSLYLWHFPLFAFASYVQVKELGFISIIALCGLSFLLSLISLQFIERPFRSATESAAMRRRVAVCVCAMVTVSAGGLAAALSHGFPSRLDSTAARYLDAEKDIDRFHMNCMSVGDRIVPPDRACHLGAANVQPSVLLWGDSHAAVSATALEQAAIRHNAAFLFAASVDCPIGVGFTIEPRTGSFVSAPAYQYCGEYNRLMLGLAANTPNIKAVVLSARWTNWRVGERGTPAEGPVDIRLRDEMGVAQSIGDNRFIFSRGFESLVKALLALKKTVWIVGPLPEPSVRIPKALYIGHLGLDNTNLEIAAAEFTKKNEFILGLFRAIADKYSVRFIWPNKALCGEDLCPVVEDGMPLFLDDNHLSVYGARKTSRLYDVIFSGL
jgi:peptidoglycan/LPS O-acetylase OafA/YrhL